MGLRKAHPAQLRADFRRYYGLDYNQVGITVSVLEAADLAACLPAESATMRAANPNWQWGVSEHLQAAQLDVLRLLLWAKTKDGTKGRNRPEPTPRPGLVDTTAGRAAGFQVLPLDELKRKLSLPRR